HYLIRTSDPTKLWTPVTLPHEPTVHRMYWVKTAANNAHLVVLPLHGRGNQGGEGLGVKVLAYEMPENPKEGWKTQVIDQSMHLTHNMTSKDLGIGEGETILIGGKEGVKSFSFQNGEWASSLDQKFIIENYSFGELSLAETSSNGMLLAGIEPMHGNRVSAYIHSSGEIGTTKMKRAVLDESLKEGHGIVTGDFLGTGTVQIVAGSRVPNEDGDFGIKLYEPLNDSYDEFKTHWIDQNGMACESLTSADLDGDGKLDLIAAGRATNNLKIYWNRR
uniref:FG-GAP repeat domain-containing protein n=1 Tax=Algoriphagus sp. TaxID=1872435 RepID=UPI0025E527CA